MVKVTWLGEDTPTEAGPSFNTWNGIRFPKGKAVEVTDEHMLAKARKMGRFYKVTEAKEAKHVEEAQGQQKVEDEKDQQKEAKSYDYREAEKGSGYSPVKKRVRKPKKPEPAA